MGGFGAAQAIVEEALQALGGAAQLGAAPLPGAGPAARALQSTPRLCVCTRFVSTRAGWAMPSAKRATSTWAPVSPSVAMRTSVALPDQLLSCVRCHGEALTGVLPGIPALVGLPRLYLSSQLGAWITNDRHALEPDCMAQVGRKLTAADINAVASWLAMQPMPANPKPIAAPPSPVPMACSALNN